MKITIATTLILLGSNAFAMNVNLDNNETTTVQELVDLGATTISCGNQSPKCILQGTRYGVQYPGQEFTNVHFTEVNTESYAISKLENLRGEGLCKF